MHRRLREMKVERWDVVHRGFLCWVRKRKLLICAAQRRRYLSGA